MTSYLSRFCPTVVAPAVLVVDGPSSSSIALAAHLRASGTRPIQVSTPTEAIAVLGSFHVDVIVIGYGMTFAEALALARRLRALADQPHVPVVVVTSADVERADANAARVLGARIASIVAGFDSLASAVRSAIGGEIVPLERTVEVESVTRARASSVPPRATVVEIQQPRARRDPRTDPE
ncbi:hypothetical protein [Sandaracinus amylolyticus]|uniref:hypothetical protein n=1 Tax=Sandaracinus amylolyticus TaxID=927083 RepID=UPI001F1D8122|nr:hypothetical protein [Sandaracinus amylolyticus]UJR83633.1 Hypothetical protein I5071_57010 [Sandaracinus amylolyticus]